MLYESKREPILTLRLGVPVFLFSVNIEKMSQADLAGFPGQRLALTGDSPHLQS